jgi:AcrR family transcriptional regulator
VDDANAASDVTPTVAPAGRNRPPRTKPRGAETHARLIQVAIETFHESGYEQASLQSIAERMGFSKAAIYYYAKNKEQLLLDVYAAILEPAIEQARAVALEPAPDNADVFLRLIRAHLQTFISNVEVNAIFQVQRSLLSEVGRAAMRRLDRDYYLVLKDVYLAGIADGSIKDGSVQVRVNAILGMCNIVYRWYKPGGEVPPEVAIDEIVEIVASAVRVDS